MSGSAAGLGLRSRPPSAAAAGRGWALRSRPPSAAAAGRGWGCAHGRRPAPSPSRRRRAQRIRRRRALSPVTAISDGLELGVMRRCCCNENWNIMSFRMVQPIGQGSWRNRSGVGCLLFCSMFDGQSVRGLLDQNNLEVAAGVVIYEAFNMISQRKGHA